MKKLVSIALLILIMFNFILCNNAYADDPDFGQGKAQEVLAGEESPASNTVTADIIEEGETSQTQDSPTKVTTSAINYGTSIIGAVTGIIARIINIVVLQLDVLMSHLTYSTENNDFKYWLTIERLVFNRIPLVNINYFNTYETEGTYKVGDIEIEYNTSNAEVKKSISGVYYICRFIAMTLGLLVLIYIGIRMAFSTIASDQAKYKKMLISWVESFIIMFLMLYIMSFVIIIGERLTEVFYNLEQSIIGEGTSVFEDTVRTKTRNYTFSLSGLQLTFWSIVYWCLLYMEVKFLWTYIKRFLMVGFLIIISPLITISYSIDKAGDGKAQAFSAWMKEFVTNVLIQPLHAIIYLIFVLTANSIAERSPLIAVAFFMAMGTAEKMVRVIFNIKNTESLKGLGDINLFKKGK